MHQRLSERTILVAGAAGAMGREIVRRLVDADANVVAGDLKLEAVELAVEPVAGADESVCCVELDVVDEASWAAAVAVAESRFGHLDGLVNAAAILGRSGVEATSVETWHQVMSVNALGSWLSIKHSAPAMRRAGGGSIVEIASVDGLVGRGQAIAYQASKGAQVMIVRSAAIELAADQIRINTVCPGKMSNTMSVILGGGAARSDMLAHTPLGRQGGPDDIANACAFLLSDEAAFITGTDLVVDGGFVAQ